MKKLKLKWSQFVNGLTRIEWIFMIGLFLGGIVSDVLLLCLFEAPTRGIWAMLAGFCCMMWISIRTDKLDLSNPNTFPESGGAVVYHMLQKEEQDQKENARLKRMRVLYPHLHNKGNHRH